MLDYMKENDIGYQCNSKNRSFIDFSLRLKERGINNWAFSLRLNDPKLTTVDPHDPKNQLEQHRVLVECMDNPWYFFREVLRIPGTNSGGYSVFKANRGNMAVLFDTVINDVGSWFTGPRCISGKTTTWVSIILWWYMFDTNHRDITIPVNRESIMTDIIWKMNHILDELPQYMQNILHDDGVKIAKVNREKQYKLNVTSESQTNGSTITFVVVNSNDEGTTKKWMTELEIFNKKSSVIAIDDVECGVIGAEVIDLLDRTQGRMPICLFTSVPSKGITHNTVFPYNTALENDVCERVEFMYDKTYADIKSIVGAAPLPIMHTDVDYRMLGKTEKWLEEQALLIGDMDICYRELLCGRHNKFSSEWCIVVEVKPDPRVLTPSVISATDLESVLLSNKNTIDNAIIENIYGLSESHIDLLVDTSNIENKEACCYYFAVSRETGRLLKDYMLPEIDYLLMRSDIPGVMWDKYGRTYHIASQHESYQAYLKGDTVTNKK